MLGKGKHSRTAKTLGELLQILQILKFLRIGYHNTAQLEQQGEGAILTFLVRSRPTLCYIIPEAMVEKRTTAIARMEETETEDEAATGA